MIKNARASAPIAYMLCILALSSLPGDSTNSATFHLGWLPSNLQNTLHIPLYMGLAVLWHWALLKNNPSSLRHGLWISGICIIFAAIDELYQSTVPGRYGSISDFLLDISGVILGQALSLRLINAITKLKIISL